MKLLIAPLFVLTIFGSAVIPPQKTYPNPFLTLKYDKVVMYNYNGYGGKEIIKDDGTLADKIGKRVVLTPAQLKKINRMLGDTATYGGTNGACFDPHMGIVYYQQEKVVAYVSICLDCNNVWSSIKIPAQHRIDKMQLYDTDTIFYSGLSKQARKDWNKVCVDFKFNYCLAHFEGIFDIN